jgi:hypothetical protein
MRAMAIMYIGPHQNPDFATDYHISPILAPPHLLAQFPPLLVQCGEKDPFVDDTVIFAGRIREAKRARKSELDLAIAGKSARFGESLRMSMAESSTPGESTRLVAMKKERDKLARETEEDWVQMVLFTDWSHAYLQMATLMSDARGVIEDLGDWINEVFSRYGQSQGEELAQAGSSSSVRHAGRLHTNGHIMRPLPSPFNSETETDDSTITFVPKKFRSPSSDRSAIVGCSSASTPQSRADDQRQATSWSDETLREDNNHGNHFGGQKKTGTGGASSEPMTPHIMEEADGKRQARGTPPPGRATKAAGQTISETELMRRRRLLDAHIFD